MTTYVLSATGEPIPEPDTSLWGRWFQVATNRQIAIDELERDGVNYRVSTVFLGLDHGYGEGDPVLWETLVFANDFSLEETMQRYSSREDALAGHAETVAAVRAGTIKEDVE